MQAKASHNNNNNIINNNNNKIIITKLVNSGYETYQKIFVRFPFHNPTICFL